MATAPKSAAKPTKKPAARRTTATAKPRAKSPAAKRPAAKKRQVSSRPALAAVSQTVRARFLAKVVLVAAALVAISLGIMTYGTNRPAQVIVAPGQGVMFVSVNGDATKAGNTVQVALYEASGKEPVNALQSAIGYPADRLQVDSVNSSINFPLGAATNTATPGLIQLARSIRPHSSPQTGTKLIVTVNFKVIKDDSSAPRLTVIKSRSLLVRSTDNQNILAGTQR